MKTGREYVEQRDVSENAEHVRQLRSAISERVGPEREQAIYDRMTEIIDAMLMTVPDSKIPEVALAGIFQASATITLAALAPEELQPERAAWSI